MSGPPVTARPVPLGEDGAAACRRMAEHARRRGQDIRGERQGGRLVLVDFARRLHEAGVHGERRAVRDALALRSERLALDVRLADVRLDGQRELRTPAASIRRDRAAVLAAPTTAFASGTVEGNVARSCRRGRCTAGPTPASGGAAFFSHLDQPPGAPKSAAEPKEVDQNRLRRPPSTLCGVLAPVGQDPDSPLRHRTDVRSCWSGLLVRRPYLTAPATEE